MKKTIILILSIVIICTLITPALAEPNPIVQELADEAYKIGMQNGLEDEALQEFIKSYIRENMPQDAIEQGHQDYINSSYEEKFKMYSEWKEQFNIYSYNSIVVGKDTGSIQDRHIINENMRKALAGLPFSNDDRFLLKPIYDCITDITLDGYLLTKTFEGQYALFSIGGREFVITYDKKYDLACGYDINLLNFHKRIVYDITDDKDLRVLEQTTYLPAKDVTTGKYGFLNCATGEVAIPFIYDNASDFYEGLAAVKKGDYWGYIDTNNNVVLDFKYGKTKGFYNGIAQVDKSFIDKKGNVLVTSKNPTLYMLSSDYYMGTGETIVLTSPIQEIFEMEIFNIKGEKVYEQTLKGDGNINTRDIKSYEYLGGSRLKYDFAGKEIVLNIPSTPIASSTVDKTITPFTDVPTNAWYFNAVYKVRDLEIITGKGDNKFDPNGNLTIAEAITLAAKTRANFNQEKIPSISGEWYAAAVRYAIQKGIIKSGDFTNYNKKATRAEMAYLFANALPESEYAKLNSIKELPDVKTSTLYQENIFKLYNAGIVSGSDKDGTFNPSSNIQRSEAAAIILRVINKTERKSLAI